MEHPAIVFTSRIDAADPASVAAFVWWLHVGRWQGEEQPRLDLKAWAAEHDRLMQDADYALEATWGWSAPRSRMALLCWQACHPGLDKNLFTIIPERLIDDFHGCGRVLVPIQQRVADMLRAIEQRKRADEAIGQGAWGEAFMLPAKEARYLNEQLDRVRYALIEQPSGYEEALEEAIRYQLTTRVRAIRIPSDDPTRSYSGESVWDDAGEYAGCLVRVTADGKESQLVNARDPFSRSLDFTWGYPGHGPSALALSLLADVAGGDLILASAHDAAFLEDVVMSWPQHEPFRYSRSEIVEWLAARGADEATLLRSSFDAQRRLKAAEPRIAPLLTRLDRVHSQGHLRAQRLDHVAADFEAALAVDIANLLQSNGTVLTCDRCHLPISVVDSVRSARQVGRWRSGRPIYHEWCAELQSRDRQKRHREHRVATDPSFLERERQRARRRRMDK